MTLLRLRPHAGPDQRNDMTVAMDIAAFEITNLAPAPRPAHFLTRIVEVVREKKFARAVARHLRRVVAKNGFGARADARQRAALVANQDQVERGIEYALIQR